MAGTVQDDADGWTVTVGRAALTLDLNFSIKAAGIARALPGSEAILDRLPRGEALLNAIASGVLTPAKLDSIMHDHLVFLKRMASALAAEHSVVIRKVIVTVANYLRPGPDALPHDFDQYVDWFLGIARDVWGPGIKCDYVNEGQAMGRYICERFLDSNAGASRHWIRDLFTNLRNQSEIPLLVVDWGSSGLVIIAVALEYVRLLTCFYLRLEPLGASGVLGRGRAHRIQPRDRAP